MKVAVLGESRADEEALHILTAAMLGRTTERIAGPSLRSRGWPSVLTVVPAVLTYLYYRTDAHGLVVIVDSNSSPLHELAHEAPGRLDGSCRWCRLREAVTVAIARLSRRPSRPMLNVGIGVAAPAIEAWYRFGVDPHVTEAGWLQTVGVGHGTHRKSELKQQVYGTDRPSLEVETRRAIEEATRLSRQLPELEAAFPRGFGALARALRSW
jgi:hypothetical protein